MRLLRVISALALVIATGCGGNAVSPTAAQAGRSVNGTWTGSYVPLCPASPYCGNISGPVTEPQAFALTLRQDGGALTGQINLTGNWLTRVANVTGTIAADGAMTLQGGDSWPASGFCQPSGGWNITGWNGRYDAGTDTITGDFAVVTQE